MSQSRCFVSATTTIAANDHADKNPGLNSNLSPIITPKLEAVRTALTAAGYTVGTGDIAGRSFPRVIVQYSTKNAIAESGHDRIAQALAAIGFLIVNTSGQGRRIVAQGRAGNAAA